LNEKSKGEWTQIGGAVNALKAHEKTLIELAKRLGLEPISRSEISVPEKPKTDKKAKYGL
jgi:phage terminase small subunit